MLFLCTGNSCRSQMAEGLARHFRGEWIEAYSAGTHPCPIHPLAVRVLAELGIDTSGQRSKHLDELCHVRFDYVVTVCGNAHENCPVLPGVRMVHRGFDDPPRLARRAGSEEERLAIFRRVRDEIRVYVETLPESLGTSLGG